MKTLKFRCFLIVACINSVILLGVRSPAVAQLIVSLPDTVVSPGDTLLLPVKVKLPQDDESVYALQFEITYESDIVSVDTVIVDTESVLWALDWEYEWNITKGRTAVAFAGTDSLSEDGTIAVIAFRISDTASGGDSSLLYFDVLWANEGIPEAVSSDGSVKILSVDVAEEIKTEAKPGKFSLWQNYPNPFNPETVIDYALPIRSDVKLTIYNLRGEEVALLINGNMPAGNHTTTWNASSVASGVYLYRLQASPPARQEPGLRPAGGFIQTRKMLLLK